MQRQRTDNLKSEFTRSCGLLIFHPKLAITGILYAAMTKTELPREHRATQRLRQCYAKELRLEILRTSEPDERVEGWALTQIRGYA